MTSLRRQLARESFLKYTSALRQTSQNLISAKKTRQYDVDNFMKINSAEKIRQHDVDEFMKIGKMNEFARLAKNFITFRLLSRRER